VTAEAIPTHLELTAQIAKVIDLAVEADDQVLAVRQHRLMAGFAQIDDGEAAMTESDPGGRVDPDPAIIGTAVTQCRCHRFDSGKPARIGRVGSEKYPCDSAHDINSVFGSAPCGFQSTRRDTRQS
jgi:hypothetical protein